MALCALGCASSTAASVTLPATDVPDVPDVPVVPVDTGPNLDDPTVRVECPPGQGDPCGPGRHCIAIGPGFLGLCVRDGARGGLCREGVIPCDESIACMEGWCARNEHFGARTTCSGALCALDEGCVELLGELRCVRHGGAGGYCRQAGSACDADLTCDDAGNNRSRCGRSLGPGERCVATGSATTYCASGLACVAASEGAATGVCVPIGDEGAPCIAGATCRAGLECQIPVGLTHTRCVRARRPGESCDNVTRGAARCGQGSNCIGSPAGLCVPDGAHTGQCRVTEPRCDAGLRCNRDAPVCSVIRAEGQPCDASSRDHDCVAGTSCVALAGTTTCARDGTLGGACLPFLQCDEGLVCDPRRAPPVCVRP